jgi:hypothetical protein
MSEYHNFPSDFRQEFPNFDPATMPAIPAGFVDNSWHNDAMPSFIDEIHHLTLWVNYANPADRDIQGDVRFVLMRTDEVGIDLEQLAYSDDMADIVRAIANARLDDAVSASEGEFGKAASADVYDHACAVATALGLPAPSVNGEGNIAWTLA